MLFLLSPALPSWAQQAKVWNVAEYQAQGDGSTDDTEAIQSVIRKAQPGDTVYIPEGKYRISTLGLRSGVHLKADGLLLQNLPDKEEFTTKKQNSSFPLIRGKDVSDIHLQLNGLSQNEAIYLTGSKNIHIDDSKFSGDSTKLRSFAGILLYQCEEVKITNSTIKNFGTSRESAEYYQPGTGIRILESKGVTIEKCLISKNGQNGVFVHSSPDISVHHCTIIDNGMSAIQVAFGSTRTEIGYYFSHNYMANNAGDAIDINNRGTGSPLDIEALIEHNESLANGFVGKESTPDGSGIATLINVSGVQLIKNTAAKNNRPAVYLEDCGNIIIDGNEADNQVEIVKNLQQVSMINNVFDHITFIHNVKAGYLCIENNEFRTIYFPNGITLNKADFLNNSFSNGSFNLNLSGKVNFQGNQITNLGKTPTFLIASAAKVTLVNNEISSEKAPGILLKSKAKGVLLQGNVVNALNYCIQDEGATGTRLIHNRLEVLPSSNRYFTIHSKNPKQMYMEENIHLGKDGVTAVWMEGSGLVEIYEEKILAGNVSTNEVKIITLNQAKPNDEN
ncbi:hypothetical protein GCM10007049_34070 [Echinicola pacifica]|uniref:Rhamnogalacturonase A/B/Epimerase-like pectate lyase domain-containing protein n=1 Tax=Echinicola pacifica TaxID=346377 RepID=A0A918Q9I8_9BACT|nr:hypothetical protein GCM10007049_34070 [Echinicola pacifica]